MNSLASRTHHVRTALKVVVPLLLIGAAVTARKRMPVDVVAATVDRGAVVQEVTGTGLLESPTELPLGFETGGRIISLAVDEGMEVRAGQLVGRLDTTDVERQLAAAVAALELSQAGIGRARAELTRAGAALHGALVDRDRTLTLASAGSVSHQGRDAAMDRHAIAEADVGVLESGVRQADGAERVARENVALLKHRISDGRLTSPMNGLVVRRYHEPGQMVAAGTPVFTIVSTEKLWVRTWIDETALGSLHVGQAARVELRSQTGTPLKGRIDRIGRQADRQTHELLVDVELVERPDSFAVGQRADVFIVGKEDAAVVRIPEGFCNTALATCITEEGGKSVKKAVKLGTAGVGFTEVLAGLAPGDRILKTLNPADVLDDGMFVRVGSGS